MKIVPGVRVLRDELLYLVKVDMLDPKYPGYSVGENVCLHTSAR